MRPYSPGGILNAFAPVLRGLTLRTPSIHRLQRGLPGYLILFAPHAFAPQRQYTARQAPSPQVFLLISTNFTSNQEFPHPLRYSRSAVSAAGPRLSPGISQPTCKSAYVRFTPSNSEQRSHPPYYRGCWHGVSRCFFFRYRQKVELFTQLPFFPVERALRPESLLHSRGVAASGLRPLCNIPTAASRRSLDRVSVPVWLIILSGQLPIVALVGHYPANKLMGHRPLFGR